jgi:hypothetical protein
VNSQCLRRLPDRRSEKLLCRAVAEGFDTFTKPQ